MAGLLDLLNSPMGKQLISGVAGQTGQPENKTADVLSMAMPLLLGAMKKTGKARLTYTKEGKFNFKFCKVESV